MQPSGSADAQMLPMDSKATIGGAKLFADKENNCTGVAPQQNAHVKTSKINVMQRPASQ